MVRAERMGGGGAGGELGRGEHAERAEESFEKRSWSG